MFVGVRYAWGWMKQLTQTEEQNFSKSTEPLDSNKKEDLRESYHFWSFSDLVLVATCFQIDLAYLCNMSYMMKNEHNPGFLQIMVMYATWGPALIYMEIFLGQYVRHGCLYLKNMSPLTCSTVGYAMLLTIYCHSVATVGRLGDSYMFLFRSFSSELPWMVCPKGSTSATCIDRELLVQCYIENNRDNCYPKLGPELLSSRIYYKAMHTPFANRAVLLFFGWLTIYVALKRTLSDTRIMVKRLLLFMLVLFVCLLAPLVVHVSRGLAVVPFFTLGQGGLFDVVTWMTAFKDFLRDHASVQGGWQLIGCHIRPGPSAANLTIYSCALTYFVTVFSQIFSTGILGVLFLYMKVTHVDEELYFQEYTKLYNLYPFALGMLQVRQIWSLIYFTLIALSSISYTVVNMVILEESMYDDFPVMLRYRGYVNVSLCVLGFLIGTASSWLSESNNYEDEFVLQIASLLTKVIVLILTFSVGYIYGIERFSDDMNFLNGSQPTAYWKICWKSLSFLILILIGGDMTAVVFPRNDLIVTAANIAYVTLLGLALLRLLYQIVMSIKARNVAEILFQATPLWGPPLPEDRRLRNTYNPREETKYWRKNNLCTHHCLLNKDLILSVIFREIDSRTSKPQDNETWVSFEKLSKVLRQISNSQFKAIDQVECRSQSLLIRTSISSAFCLRSSGALRASVFRQQQDFAAVPKQVKQNQVVIAIDKVSSAQLEAFEEQVKQKVKLLDQIEEMEVSFDQTQVKLPNTVTATRSMEESDYRIEQMIERAERRAEMRKGSYYSTGLKKTVSKTKQRRLATFVPKETPRAKKTPQAVAKSKDEDTTDGENNKVHTYAVEVPHFVLNPLKTVHRPLEATEEKETLSPPLVFSQSTSYRVSQRQSLLKPQTAMRKGRFSAWPLPLDTPQPTVSPKSSRSYSSSTSIAFEEVLRPNVEEKTVDPSQRTKESAVDIDQAIQIRIDNLLRGVRNPRRSTDRQRPGGSSAVRKAKNISTAARGQLRPPKTRDQSRAGSSVVSKISALEKRIVQRMTRGSINSRRRISTETVTNESDKRSTSIEVKTFRN